ncbi:MAG: Ig-like domain-containing protein, partial [bacterium]
MVFDVTVSGFNPTGTVTLKDGGTGGTAIGNGTLSGNACAITNTTLAVGTHANIVAVYNGDGNYNPSTSSALEPAQVVNPGAPAKLAFGIQPSDTIAGAAISPAVTVLVQDAYGNLVTGDTGSVTIGSGTTAIAVGSTLTVSAVGGVATFSNLKPATVGAGNTLTAGDGSLTGATSNPFIVYWDTAHATTVTDDFSTSHDYLTGGVSGTIWDGILNQSAANV